MTAMRSRRWLAPTSLKDTGHWVLADRPKETTEALMKFL
jgi:hypothetical protein